MSEATIERFFETYAERYMASDANAVTAMYEVPMLAVREGVAIHLGDNDALFKHLSALMEAYRNAGAARATIAAINSISLGRSSMLTMVRWNVQSDDGTAIRDFVTSYHMLRRENDEWRILSYTNHD
ncbi:MAG: hypothetical protein WD895_01100 [Acidimicrobiia bacterium]